MIRRIFITLCIAMTAAAIGTPRAMAQSVRYDVRKIWDNGSHCAFTSLIRFKGQYYCS